VAVSPSTVTVAVLNGTTTAGLASSLSSTLTSKGYHRGTVANAPTQQHARTIVAYTPGHRSAAAAVARSIGLGGTTVSPIDPATEAIAGPAAQVVVTVGANRR
jgi:hypothetical protein